MNLLIDWFSCCVNVVCFCKSFEVDGDNDVWSSWTDSSCSS